MTQTQSGPAAALRARTFTWSDPSETVARMGRATGLEMLQAIGRGELAPPPVMHMLGVDRLEVEEGVVRVYLPAAEYHYNVLGTVHGGVLATVLDTAAACAVQSTLPAGVGYTSLDLAIKFLRPVTVDSGMLVCTGSLLSRGRRTALAEARLTDARDRLVAHATSSCLLFDVQGRV